MRALKRSLAGLALCCLALAALLAALLLYTPQTAQRQETAAVEKVTDIPLTELAAVVIRNQRGAYAVMQTPQGVEMVSATQAAYDPAQMQALLYAATHLSGSRRNTDESTFAAYGIDQPRATVEIVTTDGARRRLDVLMTNPIDQNVYVYDEQSRSVLLVSASVAELFLRSELDYMSHSPLPIREVGDFSAIRSLEMAFGGSARSYRVECTDTSYFLTSPIHQRVPSTVVVSRLFIPLLSVYADSFASFGADLSDWGFDEAELRMTLETDEGTTRLWFVRTQEGECLMADSDSGTVYTLDADVLNALSFDYTLLTGGTAVYYGAGDLSEILFDLPEGQLALEVSGAGETLSMTFSGRALTQEEMRTLLSAMNSLTIVAELSAGQTAGEEQSLVMTARMATGVTEVTAFTPLGNGLSSVTIQGDTNFAVSDEAVASLLDTLRALASP